MKYLATALFAEGPADHAFLGPLLQRTCQELCLRRGDAPVELAPLLALTSPPGVDRRAERIAQSAYSSITGWSLLFVHADADGDAKTALEERVRPGFDRLGEFDTPDWQGVPVVPVRNTDAWTLADGDALRAVLATTRSDQELGIPSRPVLVEKLADPKGLQRELFDQTLSPARRRRRARVVPFLAPLAERSRSNDCG